MNQQRAAEKCRRVGKAQRAHLLVVGTLRFAHPTAPFGTRAHV
jgi:hypothetical protein